MKTNVAKTKVEATQVELPARTEVESHLKNILAETKVEETKGELAGKIEVESHLKTIIEEPKKKPQKKATQKKVIRRRQEGRQKFDALQIQGHTLEQETKEKKIKEFYKQNQL